jgi:hypothetical protein
MPKENLTDDELLAFAGLARLLIQADGKFSQDEADVLEDFAEELFGGTAEDGKPTLAADGPRGGDETDDDEGPRRSPVFDLIERGAAALPDEAAVRRAAQGVTRQEARELIFDVLYEVAACDVISRSEWPLLEWLMAEWNVQVR